MGYQYWNGAKQIKCTLHLHLVYTGVWITFSLENDIGCQMQEPRRNLDGLDGYLSQFWFDFKQWFQFCFIFISRKSRQCNKTLTKCRKKWEGDLHHGIIFPCCLCYLSVFINKHIQFVCFLPLVVQTSWRKENYFLACTRKIST